MASNKSRERAEMAFNELQSQFFARGKASHEIDHLTKARDEKTSRLRDARLAKEEQDRLTLKAKADPKPRKRM